MKGKKKWFFALVVAFVMIAVAGTAIAWWTTGASIPDNSVRAGDLAYSAVANGPGGKIDISGLLPAAGPDSASPKAWFFLENQGDVETMFYGYLGITQESIGGFRDYVHVKITLGSTDTAPGWSRGNWHDLDVAPADGWDVFNGTLGEIDEPDEGWELLSSRHDGPPDPWVHDLFGPGDVAVYKAVFWLDKDTPDQFQGAGLVCTINFWGTQEEGWSDDTFPGAP